MRMYIGFVNSDPLTVVIFDGFVRKLILQFDANSTQKEMHVGNTHVQKNLK